MILKHWIYDLNILLVHFSTVLAILEHAKLEARPKIGKFKTNLINSDYVPRFVFACIHLEVPKNIHKLL